MKEWTKLTKQETDSIVDGLVYLLRQAERQLVKFEKMIDPIAREHTCSFQVRKIQSLQTLKNKF